MVEREPHVGGINVTSGTVSKTMREAALYLTGYRERNIYGEAYAVKDNITMGGLTVRTRAVMQQQSGVLGGHPAKNRVKVIAAYGCGLRDLT